MTTLYVAGPMTGLPEFNYPAFFAAEKRLRKYGYNTLNPARAEGRGHCKTWADFMRVGIADVLASDGVAVLPGWESSRGARMEVGIAVDLGMDIRSVQGWITESVSA